MHIKYKWIWNTSCVCLVFTHVNKWIPKPYCITPQSLTSDQKKKTGSPAGRHMNASYDQMDTGKLHTKHLLASDIGVSQFLWTYMGRERSSFLSLDSFLLLTSLTSLDLPTLDMYLHSWYLNTPTISWLFVITNYHLYVLHFFPRFISFWKKLPLLHHAYIKDTLNTVCHFIHFVWSNFKFKIPK